jgi:hypothetical protein
MLLTARIGLPKGSAEDAIPISSQGDLSELGELL